MKNDDSAQSLRAICQAANQQVGRWSDGSGVHRAARVSAAEPRGKRLLTFGLLGGSSLLALAFVAERLVGAPAVPDAGLAASVAAMSQAAPSAPAPVIEAGAARPVERQGDALLINFDQVPLPDAVALLARETRTTVHDAELLQPSMLVTLHLRARNVGDAWKQVLQGRATFSIACPLTGCEVVIAGERSLAAGAATRSAGSSGAAPDAVPAKAPTEAELSQPDGSC